MNIREKEFSKLESESLDLKHRLEFLVSENNHLFEKVHKANLTLFRIGAGTGPQKHLTG